MSYPTKNYREQGGEKIIIGGEVLIVSGAKVVIDPQAIIQGLPTTSFTPCTSQATSNATTTEELVSDLNSLLAKLRAAGLMST